MQVWYNKKADNIKRGTGKQKLQESPAIAD